MGLPPKSTKIKNALMVLSGFCTFFLAFDGFCNPFDYGLKVMAVFEGNYSIKKNVQTC